MKRFSPAPYAFVVLLFGLLITSAQAQLVLTIDTDAETLTFSGSDTGTTAGGGLENPYVTWQIGSFAGNYVGDMFFAGVETNNGTINSTSLNIRDVPYYQIRLSIPPSGAGEHTLSGTSVAFSYADKSSTFKSLMSDLTGSSIPLISGSGFSAINVVSASAVPEPSAYAAIFGGLALAGAVCRRRRRNPHQPPLSPIT